MATCPHAINTTSGHECNMYALNGDDITGAWGYISNCDATSCSAGYENIGKCENEWDAWNGKSDEGCNKKCRINGSPYSTQLGCAYVPVKNYIPDRVLCRKKESTYKGKAIDCCMTDEKNKLKSLDCPLTLCMSAPKCKDTIREYCIAKGLSDFKCQQLKSIDSTIYNDIAADICLLKDGSEYPNMDSFECQNWCATNKKICSTILPEHCKNKYTGNIEDLQKYNATCGCFYPSSVYKPFYDEIEKKYNLPPGFAQDRPMCNHPFCATAIIKDGDITTCKNYNIMRCLQKSKIVNNGEITGNINIDATCIQSSDSNTTLTSQDTNTLTNEQNICTTNADCVSPKECINKQCSEVIYNKNKYDMYTIIAVVIIIVIIISIIFI
jgi:hypothetical protein